MTQQQLAERAGVSTRAVSDLERGINRAPRPNTLSLLADALSLSDDERERWTSICEHGSPVDRPQPVTANTPRQLPRPLTSFVGRDDELCVVRDRLTRADTRLVTLTGPGGVGKTRLALAVVECVEREFADGVYVVNLAPLTDPALVIPTVAQSLGVHVAGVQSVQEAIATWLRHRTVLVVLDNVEHLLAAAPEVATLLNLSPGLTILATSRAPLRINAEREIQVPPLRVPTGDWFSAHDLDRSDAVQLFVERAQAVRSSFALNDANATTIAAICTRLDGLPLAIELAAARLRLLSPQALLARLSHSLPLLVNGPRDAPDRQQTLFDTIAWSYNLLAEPEQRLFRQLTIFAGGWTLEAAEAVCDADLNVLAGMSTLIDHNLVRKLVQRGEASRSSMLETIHEFGRQRLAEHDEFDAVAGRHLTYVAASIERMNAGLGSHEQEIWIERLL
ncbi:MAG TPA: helix-turn-helix domain-containing protein, partial [Thermomicrobiales bacterium]|nr:helix-turn-helix domain-containing protein [Thermomicrobiales bacterium]